MKKLLLFLTLCTPVFADTPVGYITKVFTTTGTSSSISAITGALDKHILLYVTTGTPATLSIQIECSTDGTVYNLCGTAQTNTTSGTVTVIGVYNSVRINLTTLTGGSTPTVTGTLLSVSTIASSGSAGTQAVAVKSTAYTVLATDFLASNAFVFTCSSSCDATLPASAPSVGQFISIKNNGTGSLFVMPNGLTLDGQAAPLIIPVGYSATIHTDAANYFSETVGSISQLASRRRASAIATGSASIVAMGVAINTSTPGPLTSNSATASEGQFENSATAASLNSEAHQVEVGGVWGIANTGSNIRWSGRFGVDDGLGGVTNLRAFFGLMDTNSAIAGYYGASSTDTPSQNSLYFRCSSTVPDANWVAVVSKGGTGGTVVSTGVACNTTNHTFTIQEHGGATAYFYIDGAFKVCIGSDTGCTSAGGRYPNASAARMMAGITTLAATAANYHFFWMETETDR